MEDEKMNPYYKNVFSNGKNGAAARYAFPQADPPVQENLPAPERFQTRMQPTGAPRMPAPAGTNHPEAAPLPAQGDIYSYPQNLKDALDMLRDAIGGEAQDRVFYEFLVNAAPTRQDRTIIQGMIEDEMEHYNIFRQIYTHLSGKEAPVSDPQNVAPGTYTYCEGLRMALMEDDRDITDYGKILFALQDRRTINMMTRVLLDEIRHTNLLHYMYSENRRPS